MPELPEVETVRAGLAPHCEGAIIVDVLVRDHRLRWPVPADLPAILKNQTIQKIERRAKYLLLHFDHGTLLWHLGMTGQLRVLFEKQPPQKHDHIDVVFTDGRVLRYTDTRRFGSVHWCDDWQQHKLVQVLGPEPLSSAFNATYLYQQCQRKTVAIKVALMNQALVVGVGNIYANEALHLATIHPLLPAKQLTKDQATTLVASTKKVLKKAIKAGGTTLKDFVDSEGKPGYFRQELLVYGRDGEPCRHCGFLLIKQTVAGRATYWCEQCVGNGLGF